MMSTIDAPVTQVRYVELDSLRGFAALIVVLRHLHLMWETDTQPAPTILSFFLGLLNSFGNGALMLFFVLSGFVLALQAVDGKPQFYFTFVTRRVFRIYVPYLAALAVSVAGAFWLHGIITRGGWFHECWSEPVNWRLVGQHVLFLGDFDTAQFDPPIWSLVHEMRISLVFPFLCGLVLRLKGKWCLAIVAGLTLCTIVLTRRPLQVDPALANSLHFAGFFVLGIYLAREKSRLGAWFRFQRRPAKILLGAAFLFLSLFANSLSTGYTGEFLGRSLFYMSQWLMALGGGGVIIVSLNSASCNRVLSWRPIHFLGQISYSLYLWHFVVLLYCVHLLYGRIPLLAILCLVLVLSIVVSWYFYRWILVPSINLGRRLSNAFQNPSGA